MPTGRCPRAPGRGFGLGGFTAWRWPAFLLGLLLFAAPVGAQGPMPPGVVVSGATPPIGPDGKAVTALVTNSGLINAEGGSVLLTAAAVDGIVSTLVNAGGRIAANTTAAGQTGTIVMRGVGGSLTIEGDISVAGIAPGTTGGSVQATASKTVAVTSTPTMSATFLLRTRLRAVGPAKFS